MTGVNQTARRYLLGDLSEAEQESLEQAYFEDATRFAEVEQEETALIDDYVRGRLPVDVRRRFEAVYLSRPERRARVAFSEVLLARTDAPDVTVERAIRPSPNPSWWDAWMSPRQRLVLGAVAGVLALGLASWMTQRSTPAPDEAQQVQTNTPPPVPSVTPSPATPTLAVVTLALTVGAGERSPLSSPTIVNVPANTDTVRLALTLRQRDYGRYRVVVRAIGGAEIVRQGDLKPNLEPSSPAFTIDIAAAALPTGDYMLTLQGAVGAEFDDLSQSIIRVQR